MTKAMRCWALAEAANGGPPAAIAARLTRRRRSIVIPKEKADSNLGRDCSGFRAGKLREANGVFHLRCNITCRAGVFSDEKGVSGRGSGFKELGPRIAIGKGPASLRLLARRNFSC